MGACLAMHIRRKRMGFESYPRNLISRIREFTLAIFQHIDRTLLTEGALQDELEEEHRHRQQ